MPAAPTGPAKICIKCAQDCSTKPRTKDSQGRYTCKACADAAPAPKRPASPKPAAAIPADDDAAMMAALMADSPADLTENCPSCGSGLVPGSVLCTICGYNKETGRTTGKTMKSAAAAGAGSAALGMAASLGGAAAKKTGSLVLGAIGGVVGGAVGAAVWAGVAYGLHYEVGYIAWGIGFLVGVGVAALSGGGGGLLTGLLAAVIALFSVFGGKYAAVSLVVNDVTKEITSSIRFTDEDAQLIMADQLIDDAEKAGKTLKWPQGMNLDKAETPEDYPPEIWADVQGRWSRMSDSDRVEYRQNMQNYAKESFRAHMSDFKSEGFLGDFGPFDILWLVLAVGTAFTVGANGGAGKD